MKRSIELTQIHMNGSSPGAATNAVARAINDHIRSGYKATYNGSAIRIWKKGFSDHSEFMIPINPGLLERFDKLFRMHDPTLPIQFELDFPAEYHRRAGRNLMEDFEFMERHGE